MHMQRTLGSGSGLNGEGIRMSTLPALRGTSDCAESPGCRLFTTLNGSELGIGDARLSALADGSRGVLSLGNGTANVACRGSEDRLTLIDGEATHGWQR